MAEQEQKSTYPDRDIEEVVGKGIIVTGGTTGIGGATARLLASRGAKVLIFGRHEEELNDAMNDLRHAGSDVHGMIADASKSEDIKQIFEAADAKLGRVDVLVNNAALAAGRVAEWAYEDWEYVVRTNLLGYMACAHEAITRMKKQGSGHIVNIGSMSANVREEGSSVYVATKSGIQGFSEALRKEVNRNGIKVTLIEPGSVGTDMQQPSPEEQRQKEEQGEMLRAEDIAACVYYCLIQPKRCDVVEVRIRPHLQEI